jgi:hypothetical protein
LIWPFPHSGSGICSKRRSSRPWNRTAFIIFPDGAGGGGEEEVMVFGWFVGVGVRMWEKQVGE